MQKINISDIEREVLRSHSKTSPLVLIRFKSQAVLLAGSGASVSAISDVFDRSQYTIRQWLKDWRLRRLSSIFTGHKDNSNASKLAPEQKEEIQQALQSPPSDFGLPKEFWDVPQLKQYVEASFGVQYESDKSYHFLLKFSNLSFKYPDTFDLRRNESLIAERMAAIRSELASLLKDETWDVFAVDEIKLQQDAIIRRA